MAKPIPTPAGKAALRSGLRCITCWGTGNGYCSDHAAAALRRAIVEAEIRDIEAAAEAAGDA